MVDILSQYASQLGITVPVLIALMIVAIWDGIWKLIGMWKAAGNKHLVWFISIGIFNTIGILPMLYIYVFSKMNFNKKPEIIKNKKTSSKVSTRKKR